MRRLLLIILFISCCPLSIWAQSNSNLANERKTYAVIVGISAYESDGIPKLNFAHRDAEEFEKFLLSKAGGSVPSDNIRILLNTDATYTSIYNAWYWLLETANKDDLVYFYFSGHGDMENNTIDNLGFLLAVNTPRTNYLHNAIRIEDINRFANTLSVTRGSRVILITDACHSGDLAGKNIRGNQLTGDQLRTATGKEIRITSCGPNELSNEDEKWGGGRGVFSYYLVKGLEGLADFSNDRVITLEEVKSYLTQSFQADKILSQKENKQTPVVSGTLPTPLARVDKQRLDSLRLSVSPAPIVEQTSRPKPMGTSPQGYFFSLVDKWNVEKQVNFHQLRLLPSYEIPYEFIRQVTETVRQKITYDSLQVNRLIKSLETNADALKRFNDKLIEVLSDRGQRMINLYLEGDEAELEKRRYYSKADTDYDVFAAMLDVALKISKPRSGIFSYSAVATGSDAYLPECLELKYHYFSGVATRLKMPLFKNTDSLLAVALREQQEAYKIEKNAAYINNELGILYKQKNNLAEAEKFFLSATQIAPNWAMPWANLAGLYAQMNKRESGFAAAAKARDLQPGFQGAYVNTGILYEKDNNLLFAEEYYRKSIRLNTRHYLPFERLGYVYMNTTRYAAADSFFLEADIRKRGYNFNPSDLIHVDPIDESIVMSPHLPCDFDTNMVKKNDVLGNLYIGLLYVDYKAFPKAEKKFKEVINIDPDNPLVFHFLGKLYYDQQRWQEADIVFNYALQFHLDKYALQRYCDSLAKLFPYYLSVNDEKIHCVLRRVQYSWVPKIETRFLLGTAYERWNHVEEAEKQFRAIMKEEPTEIAAYYKCWTLLEKNERYHDAEAVIKSIADKSVVRNELLPFYKRVTAKYPEWGEWFYKAGSMVYDMAMEAPELYENDRKYIKDDTDEESYMNRPYIEQSVIGNKVPATGDHFDLHTGIRFPLTEGLYFLRKADSLLKEPVMMAEVYYKIGDLYTWQGLPQRATAYYKKSLELKPDNANTRMKYINTSAFVYNLETALAQLDSLYSRKEINFSHQVLMAEYYIHAGKLQQAGKLLKDAEKAHPYKIPAITDLNARMQLIAKNPKMAIPFYREYLGANPNDPNTHYTLARLYASLNNATEAFKWLALAINKGFDYYWVLKFDESWNKFRSMPKWKQLTEGIQPKG